MASEDVYRAHLVVEIEVSKNWDCCILEHAGSKSSLENQVGIQSLQPSISKIFTKKLSSNHSNLEMEAEFLTKNLSYLNLNISRTKNGRNKL